MTDTLKSQIVAGKAVSRADLLTVLQVGLVAGEQRFVRELAEDWLNVYPYDLHVELLRARALMQENKAEKALKILVRLTDLDPQFAEAQDSLARVARRVMPAIAERARASAAALSKPSEVTKDIQDWGQGLVKAQVSFAEGNYKKAESEIQVVLLSKPPSPLPALLHLQIALKQDLTWHALHNLVELYREQWPHALQFRLMHAAQLIESGNEKEALDILHDCVAEDVSGQSARRLWGNAHRFSALWPSELAYAINIPLPAKVAAGLGWNHLDSGLSAPVEKAAAVEDTPAPRVSKLQRAKAKAAELAENKGETITVEPVSKALKKKLNLLPETPIDLEQVNTDAVEALKLRADGRFPAYIVLTTRGGLEKQYGEDGLKLVDQAMRGVVKATAAEQHWDSHLIYADDAGSVGEFGLNTAKANDAWDIKHLLRDLDEALRAKGEMIGAVLIVGGPQIVPFHHLPNPVDDEDKDVPSDNPYASVDENYFVPTWPLGRLPNGEGSDPSMLIKALDRIAASRGKKSGPAESAMDLVSRILAFFGLWRPKRASFGYSAEIWRRASHSVYRTIGEARGLSISPPIGSGKLPKEATKALQVAYFNLHGLEESGDWYGQRDPQITNEGPDYPIALSPADVVNSGRAPQVIFTEACYGAHIFGKTVDTALSLKFLQSGSKAIVGSTSTSYGSVTIPLIAADLLGATFWKLLNEGHPVGEALRRAKIAMAHTMHRRQGYLDGEDQKTLISFVLYGDPLAQVASEGSVPKRILRAEAGSPEVNAICDLTEAKKVSINELPEHTLATVKAVVSEYLPGMQGSKASFSHEHVNCQGHDCPWPHHRSKVSGLAPNRSLVTLSKKVQGAGHTHPHYARITMDAAGTVVKLAVSR
jgi:tetratricopeptide (TPR) repeat protein